MSAYDGSKKYVVWFVDEYDNNYLIGFFDDLREAEPDLNGHLSQYTDEETGKTLALDDESGHLSEYPGSFGPCFDRTFYAPCGAVQIRGFVLR